MIDQTDISESADNVVFLTPQTGWDADVERINQYDFYELSKSLQRIMTHDGDVTPHEVLMAVWVGQRAMHNLLAGRPVELGVSRGKAARLSKQIDEIVSEFFTEIGTDGTERWRFPSKDEGKTIPGFQWGWVRNALSDFEMIFAEEMRERATYRVPDRGIYNTAKLVDAADCTFPEDLAGFVPPKTKTEWKAAGRCLAFGMFTACGFHVARAVEGALESYFSTYNGGPDAKKKQWGEYLAALEKIAASGAKPSPDAKTMAELKQMKDDWRNPLMHPRVVLGEAEARTVFNNGETLIMLMVQEIAAAVESGVQPSLSLIGGEGAA